MRLERQHAKHRFLQSLRANSSAFDGRLDRSHIVLRRIAEQDHVAAIGDDIRHGIDVVAPGR